VLCLCQQSYFGVEVENVADTVKRNAILTMIRTTGQTPKQLFTTPHPVPAPRTVSPSKASSDRVVYLIHQIFL
jgi:hypothetical protein